MPMSNLPQTHFIGIDGGGSKCRAIVSSDGKKILALAKGGPANPCIDIELAKASILDVCNQASSNIPQLKLADCVVGIGLAGVNLPLVFDRLTQWRHPFRKLYLTTDVNIANIAAHDGKSGGVIVVGTGSCGLASNGNTTRLIGGHGFLVGDHASGAWLGLKAIEHSLLVKDGLSQKSHLSDLIYNFYKVNNAQQLSEMMITAKPHQFAEIAPLVFKAAEQNDSFAAGLVDQGLNYILKLALNLEKCYFDQRHSTASEFRLSLIGGLAKTYLQKMNNHANLLFNKKLSSLFSPAIALPEYGALNFAQQHWKNNER